MDADSAQTKQLPMKDWTHHTLLYIRELRSPTAKWMEKALKSMDGTGQSIPKAPVPGKGILSLRHVGPEYLHQDPVTWGRTISKERFFGLDQPSATELTVMIYIL